MIPVSALNRPPDTVTQLYSCDSCKRIVGNESTCSKCGGSMKHVGQAGLWKPQEPVDLLKKIEAMQKQIEELQNKK